MREAKRETKNVFQRKSQKFLEKERGEWKEKMKPKFNIELSVLCIKDIYTHMTFM